MPLKEALAAITQFQSLYDEALSICRRYDATKDWGERELRIVFRWMRFPPGLDGGASGDAEAMKAIRSDQIAFANLFACGPNIIDPLDELRGLYNRARRNKALAEAMEYGRRNDILNAWNRIARTKKNVQPLAHLMRIWSDKADALAEPGKKRSARDVENLRAQLRKLAAPFPRKA